MTPRLHRVRLDVACAVAPRIPFAAEACDPAPSASLIRRSVPRGAGSALAFEVGPTGAGVRRAVTARLAPADRMPSAVPLERLG